MEEILGMAPRQLQFEINLQWVWPSQRCITCQFQRVAEDSAIVGLTYQPEAQNKT